MNPITGAITVAVADEHTIVREGLRHLLSREADIEMVDGVDGGHDLLDVLRREPVDVAMVNLSVRDVSAMELVRRIRDEFPDVAVLVLTPYNDEMFAERAFRCGAHGFVTKDSDYPDLLSAIRKVAQGGLYVDPKTAERLAQTMRHVSPRPLHETLSNREMEVYRRIVAGMRVTDIAQELHVSVKTISTHKAHIMEKLHVDCTASLVRYGMHNQLFDTPTPNPNRGNP